MREPAAAVAHRQGALLERPEAVHHRRPAVAGRAVLRAPAHAGCERLTGDGSRALQRRAGRRAQRDRAVQGNYHRSRERAGRRQGGAQQGLHGVQLRGRAKRGLSGRGLVVVDGQRCASPQQLGSPWPGCGVAVDGLNHSSSLEGSSHASRTASALQLEAR